MAGGQVLRLCLTCAGVDEHRECALVAPARTPQEKVQRVQRALGEVDRTLFALKTSKEPPTRTTLMTLLSAEGQLERFPARDLADFGQKRAYNFVETALRDRRREVEEALGDDGRATVEAFAFARRALEAAFRLACARLDASSFDASPLAALALHPVSSAANRGVSLGVLCGAIEAILEETRALDARVREWGLENLSALVAGKEPVDFPPELLGSGSFKVLGAIVGRGPASRRASAATGFKLLGDRFRERLYLLAANPILLGHASSVSQAEEAWRRLIAGDGASRWARVRRSEEDVLAFFLGALPELGAKLDETIAELARKARSAAPAALVPMGELAAEDWESLARAYFLIYDAVAKDESSGDGIAWEPTARALVEKKPGGSVDREARRKALDAVRAAWAKRPSSDDRAKAVKP